MTGRLIKNTDPHQKRSRSTPPMTGPIANPAANAAAKMPMAWALFFGSANNSLRTAKADGSRVAPAIPITARAAMSSSGVGAKAAAVEPRPKHAAPIMSSRRRP